MKTIVKENWGVVVFAAIPFIIIAAYIVAQS